MPMGAEVARVSIAIVSRARLAVGCEVVAPDVAPQAVRVVAPAVDGAWLGLGLGLGLGLAVGGAVAHHAARDAVVGHLSRGDVGHEHLGEA